MDKMTESQINEALPRVPDWGATGEAIQRTYQFKDFVDAMKFVNRVAEQAEADQHHPDILIRWNKVTLTLSTHDASGITEKDFAMAQKADGFAGALLPPKPAAPPPAPAAHPHKPAPKKAKK